MFDVRGDMWDIYPSTEKICYRLHFSDDHLDFIEKKDSLTFEDLGAVEQIWIRPGSQYMQDKSDLKQILIDIELEMNIRVEALLKS